jgi:hypothetical protein
MALFALIVDMPLRDSLNMAKIGDRASPSTLERNRWIVSEKIESKQMLDGRSHVYLPNRFSSLDVVAKIFRMRRKYQINGGRITSVTGNTVTVDTNAPITKNEMTRKSNNVTGR